MGRNDFRHFHQKHRRHQQRSTVLQSLTGLCSLGAFRSSWGGGNETKDIRSQDTSVPKTPEGKVPSLQLTRCSTACAILQPAFAGPWLQASQWDCGVQKPMKHGIVWATQTQRLPGSWRLPSAALLLVNIWQVHPRGGWGLSAPFPTTQL